MGKLIATVSKRGCEFDAENMAGEIHALLIDIEQCRQRMQDLVLELAPHIEIAKEIGKQKAYVRKLRGIYKGATAEIWAVIYDIDKEEALRVIKESNGTT